jgi:hypothetical protein
VLRYGGDWLLRAFFDGDGMTAACGFGLVLRYGVEVWWGLAFARVL